MRYQPGPCYKNQSRFPFNNNNTKIKIVGKVDSVFVVQSTFDILEDLHAPFAVRLSIQKTKIFYIIRKCFQIKIEVSRCSMDKIECVFDRDFLLPDFCAFDELPLFKILFEQIRFIEPTLECPTYKKVKTSNTSIANSNT
jgi:hypothetical protein